MLRRPPLPSLIGSLDQPLLRRATDCELTKKCEGLHICFVKELHIQVNPYTTIVHENVLHLEIGLFRIPVHQLDTEQ